MRRMPRVRFFCYTRAWRDEAIRPVLERLARLPNCCAWYSCDRETGVPAVIPPRVRLAWMATTHDDLPPSSSTLVFRIRRLRRRPARTQGGVRVCPAEDGVPRGQPVTCERCRLCWQPLPDSSDRRTSLPLLPEEGP
jgi:hypothetical protein